MQCNSDHGHGMLGLYMLGLKGCKISVRNPKRKSERQIFAMRYEEADQLNLDLMTSGNMLHWCLLGFIPAAQKESSEASLHEKLPFSLDNEDNPDLEKHHNAALDARLKITAGEKQ